MTTARRCVFFLLVLEWLLTQASATAATPAPCNQWKDWQSFINARLQSDGRVIDQRNEQHHSTSEGQSYALFFALVANDRPTFSRLLAWTENNLAGGDLQARLPAWRWGQRQDHSWGILDSNSASDADVWLAYTLTEAGRLWQEPHYTAMARQLEQLIRQNEVVDIPGLGASLLPAPQGFHPQATQWRLNPSYLPLQVFRGLSHDLNPLWTAVAASSLKILIQSAPLGIAPDWIVYDTQQGWLPDPDAPDIGSYAAIRVYLWAGMLAPASPDAARLQPQLLTMTRLLAHAEHFPEQINAMNANIQGNGPAGFIAALLPLLRSTHQTALLTHLEQLLSAALPGHAFPDGYYNQVLYLFAQGWMDGYFSFTDEGQLLTRWTAACTPKNHSSP